MDDLASLSSTFCSFIRQIVFYLQCRKFKGSEAVRGRAGVIYEKFKTLFLLSGDALDNHEVIFLVLCIYCAFSTFDLKSLNLRKLPII